MGDKTRGLYDKFNVARTDGGSRPDEKHDGCRYFVLDLDHDPHAKPAILAYAESCKKEYPKLAADLEALIEPIADCGCRTAAHELCGRIFSPRPNPMFGKAP